MNDNAVVPRNESNAVQASSLIPDTSSPSLDSFQLDVDQGKLLLTFTETIRASTIRYTHFTLQNSDSNATVTRSLDYASSRSRWNSIMLTVDLTASDLNYIKQQINFGTDESNTYISITSQAIFDMYGNNGTAILPDRALQASYVAQDQTRPELEEFSFDLNTGTVKLTFTETVNVSSLNTSFITLQDAELGETSLVLKRSKAVDSKGGENLIDDVVINVKLSQEELNSLKAARSFATRKENTFITLTSDAIRDMMGHYVVPIFDENATEASAFFPDVSSPVLQTFELDMDEGLLTVVFDETVDSLSLVMELFRLRSSYVDPVSFYNLKGNRVTTANSTRIELKLDDRDILGIKGDPNLATSKNNTWLYLENGAIFDLAQTPNSAVSVVVQASLFVADQTSPKLTTFAVNLNLGRVHLNFIEPVKTASLNTTGITLVNEVNGTSTYTLTGGTTNTPNGFTVILELSTADLNGIKAIADLWISRETTYITFTKYVITDMADNYVEAIGLESAVQASSYINDTTFPVLAGFDLDMDSGILTLSFIETVNVTTVLYDRIYLQSVSAFNSTYGERLRLTGGILLEKNPSTEVKIELTLDDLNALKELEIANRKERSWLLLARRVVVDMNRNPSLRLRNGINTEFVSKYTSDTTKPSLRALDFNLTSEELTLSFSETVRVSTLNVEGITITSSSNYTLTTDSYTSSDDGPIVVVHLSLTDLNNIKRITDLAVSNQTTSLVLTNDTIRDMVGSWNVPVNSSTPIDVRSFHMDYVSPQLLRFELNLTSETTTFYFSETVDASTFDPTQITFQEANASAGDSYTLTGGKVSRRDDPIVTLRLTTADLNVLKYKTALATSVNTTHIAVSNMTVLDMNMNFLVPTSKSVVEFFPET